MLSLAVWIVIRLFLPFGSSHPQTSPETAHTILAVAWSPDGQTYAYVDDRGNLAVVDPRRTAAIFEFSGGVSDLLHAAAEWSPDGTRLAAGIGYQVYLWDTATWELSAQFLAGEADEEAYSSLYAIEMREGIVKLVWSLNSQYLITGSVGFITTVWDDHEADIIYQAKDESGAGPGRYWLEDGWLSDGVTKRQISTDEVIFPASSEMQYQFGSGGIVIATAANPEKRQIAWATARGFVLIYDLYTLRGIQAFEITDSEPPAHRRALANISWNGIGDAIAAVSRDGEIYIADLVTGEVRTILNVPARIHAIDWNPVTGEILYGGVTDSGQPLLAIYADQTPFVMQP